MSAQPTNAKKIAGYTQAITANVTNLLTEVARASASVAPPSSTNTSSSSANNNNDEILRQLQKLNLEMARMRTDLDIIKTKMSPAKQEPPPRTTADMRLVDLMELEAPHLFLNQFETAEEYNECARHYNSELWHHSDFVAPIHNARNRPVFGFPTTLGEFANLDFTEENLLCSAFGLPSEHSALAKFCGVKADTIMHICMEQLTGKSLAVFRVGDRKRRLADIEVAGAPTAMTRRAAASHNSEARRHNGKADSTDCNIMPIHDERNLVVWGFPREFGWFLTPHRRDVLYLLGEYGQDTEPKGCKERFEAFVGVPSLMETEGTFREWFL